MSERVISKIFQLLEKEAKIVTEILININAAICRIRKYSKITKNYNIFEDC